jgi:long-chain acyl-CoA synthetase
VEFRDDLPKTMVGKVLRRALREEEEEKMLRRAERKAAKRKAAKRAKSQSADADAGTPNPDQADNPADAG